MLVLVTPPPVKPSEPGLSAHAAAMVFRGLGAPAVAIDASIGWHRYALAPERLLEARAREGGSVARRKDKPSSMLDPSSTFRNRRTYQDRRVYTSAVNELERALRLIAKPFPRFRLGIASVGLTDGARLESSSTLEDLANRPGPFDEYFEQELIPGLIDIGATHVGVSLSFQFQAPAALRLATLLRHVAPHINRVLGGPLVDCWFAAGISLRGLPFECFDDILTSRRADMMRLAAMLGSERDRVGKTAQLGPLAVPLDEVLWDGYLSPMPVVPAAIGRGCYWRRCTFCPDHLHSKHLPCDPESIEDWLGKVAQRFPSGAMLHLTDSALPPQYLKQIAAVIRRDQLPLLWHGFVRPERHFADPEFMKELAEGGCAMLQLGVESASQRLLELLGKGTSQERIRRIHRCAADSGVDLQDYLLFGLPTESDVDRELTLEMIERHVGGVLAVNASLLNLPKGSPMYRAPEQYGITSIIPFHESTDLSLYDDFRCGSSHPRVEARRWLDRRFFKSEALRSIAGNLRTPFKANHLCFLGR